MTASLFAVHVEGALGRWARFALSCGALALIAAAFATPARALTDEEVYRNLRFTDQAPGARNMGLGGAFIGLADDPSAIFMNPAGLGYADRPQLMVSLRGTDWDDRGNSVPGTFPIGPGEDPATGTYGLEDEGVIAPEFVAYVHPIGRYFTIGVSRHERLNIERDTFTGFFSTSIAPFQGVNLEPVSTLGEMDLLLDTFSVTLASAPVDQFAIGVTLSLARLDVVATHENFAYTIVDETGDGTPDSFLRPIDYRTAMDDEDTQFTFTAGLLYRPHPKIGIGLVYRDGPEFDLVEQVLQDGIRAKDLREYIVSAGIGNAAGEFINTIAIPDSYGAGIAFGPFFEPRGGGGLLISIDVMRVEYADLLDNFTAGLNNQLFGSDSLGTVFIVEDETETHFGVEWGWTVGYNNSVYLRAGAYSEADHSLISGGRAVSGGGTAGAFVPHENGDDEWHFTLGGGFTLRRGFYSFQLDAAADFSDYGEQYLGTATLKF